MATRENQSSASAPVPADGPEGSPPGGRFGRKTLLLAAVGIAIVLLAGGGLFAMWSHGAASEADEEADSPAAAQDAKKSKHAKPAAKEGKEGKSKHGKEEKKGAKEDKKKEGKTEDKSANAKKPAKEGKQASKEAKGEKGHAKPGKEEKPSETAAKEKQGADGSAQQAETEEQPAYLGKGLTRLGPFSVKIFDPLTRTMLRTDFGLEAVTVCEDETEFERFLRSSQQFLREQVMVAMRTSDAVDFADPSLQLVKRRIVARVNRALGRPFLKSVDLKNFAVYESVENSPYVRWQPAAAEGVTHQLP